MRLKLKPLATIKTLAASASAFTMCMTPVAQGAQAAKQNAQIKHVKITTMKQHISQYLKDTGMNEKQTVSQYWAKVRHVYPPKLQRQMDQWVRINRDLPMPQVEATTFKGSDGKEQVRLNLLTPDGKVTAMTFSQDPERMVKINSVTLSANDLLEVNKYGQYVFTKLMKDPAIKKAFENAPTVPVASSAKSSGVNSTTSKPGISVAKNKGQIKLLTGREFARVPNLRSQLDYMLRLRAATEAADAVFEAQGKKGAQNSILNGDAIEYVWNLLLPDANAATGPCIAAGWVASYHQNSCARANPGRETLLTQIANVPFGPDVKDNLKACVTGGGLPCDPAFYGFQDNNKSVHCITDSLATATNQCNKRAPLDNGGKEKIIQTIVAAKGKDPSLCKLNGEKEISQACQSALEKYTDDLRQHFLNAADFCTGNKVKDPNDKASWVTRKDITKNQKLTCDDLKDRYFDLVTMLDPKTGEIAPAPLKEDKCAEEYGPGSKLDNNGSCVCADGKPPQKSEEIGPTKMVCVAAAVVGVDTLDKVEKDECEGQSEYSYCRKKGLYIVGGILLAAGIGWGLYELFKPKHKKKDKKYETPNPNPEPETPTEPTDPGTVIDPPVVNPKPECDLTSNTLDANGNCNPIVIVTPPEPPPSEGGSVIGAPQSGGTR